MKDKYDSFSTDQLPSFWRYVNKTFDFRKHLQKMADGRSKPQYAPSAVFGAVFYGFLYRMQSWHQLEGELREPFLRHWLALGPEECMSEDTCRYGCCSFELEPLNQMLVAINKQLKRNKVFEKGKIRGRLVAAIDGVEFISGRNRCCDKCLKRNVQRKCASGDLVNETEYYHRASVCQIVSGEVKTFVGVELQKPEEDEVRATLRLLESIWKAYRGTFFDVLVLDALYAQSRVLDALAERNWDYVIVFKQEARDLWKDAEGLMKNCPPDEIFQTDGTSVRAWYREGLRFKEKSEHLVQVIRTEEQSLINRRYGKETKTEKIERHWNWISNLKEAAVPIESICQIGHMRWNEEDCGFNDLTQNWALKHSFLHACEKRPRKKIGEVRIRVENNGVLAVLLTLLICYNLFMAFVHLRSKLFRTGRYTFKEIARCLYRSMIRMEEAKPPPQDSCQGNTSA